MIEIIKALRIMSKDIAEIKQTLGDLNKKHNTQLKDIWIDAQDVMQTLHISRRTLQALRDDGVIPYSRIKGKFYYKAADLDLLLKGNYDLKRKVKSCK